MTDVKEHSRKGNTGKRRNGKRSHLVKQTPEQKILDHLLSIKQQVIEREILPFDTGRFTRLPHNAFTGHEYRGFFNLLMIMMRNFQLGWDDPRFVTVGKAKEIGAKFKGEKTTTLWAPLPIKETNEDTGKEEVVAMRFRTFRAFNVKQFSNLSDLDVPALKKSNWGDTPVMERIDAVKEHALANFNIVPTFVETPSVHAPHYKPALHQIVLPPPDEYRRPERFVQSLIHELMHATGAPSEMARFKQHDADFHNEEKAEYAYEEMVAQFATASLLAQYGFPHETKRSAAYILSWYKVIEDKPEILGKAIREAMSVINHILKDNPLPDYSDDEEDPTTSEELVKRNQH
ncbi:MAG: zincin-like metallopeptidase domain-containing protein [Chloroflexota bacterium]|nr:zincin-like metallopeptidase domain-containing protein [Chloroflexota bacterium]